MSATNIITTAAVVAGGGLVAAVAYAQFQKGRALAAGTKAAGQLAAASGDPSLLQTTLDALKAAGGETGGAARAAGAVASNDNAGAYGIAALDSARQAMRQAQTPAQLGRNLRVVRPLDKSSQWGIGEGCWLPQEGADNKFRTDPVDLVRGLDLGYALTYLPDVYPAPSGSGAVVAYHPRHGVIMREIHHGQDFKSTDAACASPGGLQAQYQIMLTSTAQGGGQVALWDSATGGFLPPGSPVQFAIEPPANWRKRIQNGRDTYLVNYLDSSFLIDVSRAMKRKLVYQPFPPIRLVSKR